MWTSLSVYTKPIDLEILMLNPWLTSHYSPSPPCPWKTSLSLLMSFRFHIQARSHSVIFQCLVFFISNDVLQVNHTVRCDRISFYFKTEQVLIVHNVHIFFIYCPNLRDLGCSYIRLLLVMHSMLALHYDRLELCLKRP